MPIYDIRTSRNKSKNQIKVTAQMINVRVEPSLSAETYRGTYCPVGCYDVLDIKDADGYT